MLNWRHFLSWKKPFFAVLLISRSPETWLDTRHMWRAAWEPDFGFTITQLLSAEVSQWATRAKVQSSWSRKHMLKWGAQPLCRDWLDDFRKRICAESHFNRWNRKSAGPPISLSSQTLIWKERLWIWARSPAKWLRIVWNNFFTHSAFSLTAGSLSRSLYFLIYDRRTP